MAWQRYGNRGTSGGDVGGLPTGPCGAKGGAQAGPWRQFPRALNRKTPTPGFPLFPPIFPPFWPIDFPWDFDREATFLACETSTEASNFGECRPCCRSVGVPALRSGGCRVRNRGFLSQVRVSINAQVHLQVLWFLLSRGCTPQPKGPQTLGPRTWGRHSGRFLVVFSCTSAPDGGGPPRGSGGGSG